MNTRVTALIREGFSEKNAQQLPAGVMQIHYQIGEPFERIWQNMLARNPAFVLLIDSAIELKSNFYFLMLQLLRSNPGVAGITYDSSSLPLVYGLSSENIRRSRYSAQPITALPSWLSLLNLQHWEAQALQTPEFFLLANASEKKLIRINTMNISFDSALWAGDLIAGSAASLAADYDTFRETIPHAHIPPQFRVTVPGNRNHREPPIPRAHPQPLFSIICPSIRPEFLPEAIESVIHQQYNHWELLLGIDGPKETIRKKIEQVVTPYLADGRISIFYCEHIGTGPMRSFLSRKAKGDYIIGLDDDDKLLPQMLQRFAEVVINEPDTIIIRGGIKLFGLLDTSLPARTRFSINGISNDLFEANQPYAFKRSTLEELGGLEWDDDLKNAGEESDLLLKADALGMKLVIVDEPLYERRLSTYNQTLDCTAEECLKHVHNLYAKHNPGDWQLADVNISGEGANIRMLTTHKVSNQAAQVVCSTEFINFQQVGSRDGVILDLEITSLCNADCAFCPRDHLYRTSRFMSLDTVKSVAASLKSAKLQPTVVLCGIGESTLHPELREIISALSAAGANVCMTTNGWTLSVDYVETLVAAGLSELNVSLNAATADTHSRIMRLKNFNAISQNCREIAGVRMSRWPSLKFHVSFVLTEANVHEVNIFVDLWSKSDVSRIWLHPLTNRAGQISKTCKPVEVNEFADRYSANPKVLVDLFPGHNGVANLCHIAKQVDFISVEGNMLLCAQDYTAGHVFGNINNDHLDNLHHYKLLSHLRGETAKTCSKCSFCPQGFRNAEANAYTIVQSKDY